jgi:hypothetical protein
LRGGLHSYAASRLADWWLCPAQRGSHAQILVQNLPQKKSLFSLKSRKQRADNFLAS